MKTKLIFVIITGAAAACCNHTGGPSPYAVDAVALVDQTDLPTTRPQVAPITSVFDTDIYQGFRLTIAPITEKDINAEVTETLPEESSFSVGQRTREAQVKNFRGNGQAYLDKLISDIHSGQNHSVIYRTLARHLNMLAHSTARRRVVYVYSDLMENDIISFYKPEKYALLTTDPDFIECVLGIELPLENLRGITVYLLYNPKDFANNRQYMTVAGFFQKLLSSHGATVHIGNSING